MAVITEAAIRELAGIRGDVAPITSCYLDVDGRRLTRHQDVEHELEGVLRSGRARANGHRSVHDDLRRIEAFVRGGIDRRETRGLAIFACTASQLWEVIELPKPVRTRLVINDAPAVGQLESMVQEHEPVGVLLADRQRAQLYVFQLGRLVDRSELLDELPRDYDSRGERERGTPQHHREELAHQHLRHAARAAFDLWQARGFHHLAIGAPDAIQSELEGGLHPYLRERLCGRISVGVGAPRRRGAGGGGGRGGQRRTAARGGDRGPSQGGRRHGPPRHHRARPHPPSAVRAPGRAAPRVEGVPGAGVACSRHQCLAVVGPRHPDTGAAMERVEDVVEDAIEEAINQGVPVTICVADADLDVMGRIGALLRY